MKPAALFLSILHSRKAIAGSYWTPVPASGIDAQRAKTTVRDFGYAESPARQGDANLFSSSR
jgi:hypothetical protein